MKKKSKFPASKYKKYTFAQLESLIQQSKTKVERQKWTKLNQQKWASWEQAWAKGRERLKERQQAQRVKKERQIQLKQIQEQDRQQAKTRWKEIYDYYRKELVKLDRSKNPQYFTAHLDLDPITKKELTKLSKKYPEHDFFAEFRQNKKNLVYRLNKGGSEYLLRQTNKAYQEEVRERNSEIRYWQEQAGLTKSNSHKLIKKGQKIKLFFPEKGEHKEFFTKNKEFKQTWREIASEKNITRSKTIVAEKSKELYYKSPWRIRDRFMIATDQPSSSYSIGEVFDKYIKNKEEWPYNNSWKSYRKAFIEFQSQTSQQRGEIIPDSEVEVDRYGRPRLKSGQSIAIDSSKPGRKWTVYKNVPDLKKTVKENIHDKAHEYYIEEYGTEEEKNAFASKKNKSLCVIETRYGYRCEEAVGTSAEYCLICVYYGENHPPILPIHCPWSYKYESGTCKGNKWFREATEQYHHSKRGEKSLEHMRDWGTCHLARTSMKRVIRKKRNK